MMTPADLKQEITDLVEQITEIRHQAEQAGLSNGVTDDITFELANWCFGLAMYVQQLTINIGQLIANRKTETASDKQRTIADDIEEFKSMPPATKLLIRRLVDAIIAGSTTIED